MMRNGLFRHLLPGDEDTEGLEGVGLRAASGECEQALIGLARRRSNVGGKGAFQLYCDIPVGAKLHFGSSKCVLCGKGGVELHISYAIPFFIGNGKDLESRWLCLVL